MEQFFKQIEETTNHSVLRIQIDSADFQNFKSMYKDDRDGVNDQKFLEHYTICNF